MKTIVAKFGGTSVSDEESREYVYYRLKEFLDQGNKVVVVVSAMGRAPSPYATDTLLSLAQDIDGQDKDRLISLGETISAIVLGSLLKKKGLDAVILTAEQCGIITDSTWQKANVIGLDPTYLIEMNKQHDIVIVPGFQGMDREKRVTTLGRGGSDLTAMLVATELGLDEVFIYSDVDGVYTKDPRKNPDAKKYAVIDYDELLGLIYYGAKVMNEKSILWAKQHQIKAWVKSTWSTSVGTLICNKEELNGKCLVCK